MKTLGIIGAIIGIVSLLGWIVVQTLSSHKEDASYNMHPSNFEKPRQENVVQFQEKNDKDENTLLLTKDNELPYKMKSNDSQKKR
ncbi:MAG: hypothetical protein HEP71_26685 [Roseivirga sp.]|nr:hypothetical protein [Roseivirga sp.]